MKKLFSLILFLCFGMLIFADVGNSPPIEKQGIEITAFNNVVTIESPALNQVGIEDVLFINKSAIVNSFTTQMIERLDRYEANKSSLNVIRNIIEEGSSGDYSTFINNDIDNIQKELITKLNYSGDIEHRIRGDDNSTSEIIEYV